MIYQNKSDLLINLTKELGCGVVCKNEYTQIYNTINLIYNAKVTLNRDQEAIDYYSWEQRAELLSKKIELL